MLSFFEKQDFELLHRARNFAAVHLHMAHEYYYKYLDTSQQKRWSQSYNYHMDQSNHKRYQDYFENQDGHANYRELECRYMYRLITDGREQLFHYPICEETLRTMHSEKTEEIRLNEVFKKSKGSAYSSDTWFHLESPEMKEHFFGMYDVTILHNLYNAVSLSRLDGAGGSRLIEALSHGDTADLQFDHESNSAARIYSVS